MSPELGPAVHSITEEYDDDAMLEELALRAYAILKDPAIAGSLNPDVAIEATHLGVADDLRELGTRIYKRIMRELYSVVCGDATEDKKDRESILSSIGASDVVLGAAIAAVLTTTFGMAPAVATVAAALLIKRIFNPAGGEICQFWGQKLRS
jgi:hypothetical protein